MMPLFAAVAVLILALPSPGQGNETLQLTRRW